MLIGYRQHTIIINSLPSSQVVRTIRFGSRAADGKAFAKIFRQSSEELIHDARFLHHVLLEDRKSDEIFRRRFFV